MNPCVLRPFGWLAWLTFSAAWLASMPCRAQSIAIDPSCEEELAGFGAALAVELVDRESELARPAELALTLECDARSVTVRVSDPGSERFVGQRVERVERGLVRQLAIVAAELLAALASQREALRAEVRDEAETPRVEAPRVGTPAAGRPVGLRLMGSVMGQGTPLAALGGGTLGLSLDPFEAMRLLFELGVMHTRTNTERGGIETTTFALGISARFGAHLGAVWLGAGPLVRGGAALFGGQPLGSGITGREAVLPWLAVGAVLTMAVAIEGTPLAIELDLEGGGLPLSSIALVDGRPGFDLGPAFFGAQLGLALRLS